MLNLASEYCQVQLESRDQENIVFVIPPVLYEFRTMALGLTNAPPPFGYTGLISWLNTVIVSDTLRLVWCPDDPLRVMRNALPTMWHRLVLRKTPNKVGYPLNRVMWTPQPFMRSGRETWNQRGKRAQAIVSGRSSSELMGLARNRRQNTGFPIWAELFEYGLCFSILARLKFENVVRSSFWWTCWRQDTSDFCRTREMR